MANVGTLPDISSNMREPRFIQVKGPLTWRGDPPGIRTGRSRRAAGGPAVSGPASPQGPETAFHLPTGNGRCSGAGSRTRSPSSLVRRPGYRPARLPSPYEGTFMGAFILALEEFACPFGVFIDQELKLFELGCLTGAR